MGERPLDSDLHQCQGGEKVSIEASLLAIAEALNNIALSLRLEASPDQNEPERGTATKKQSDLIQINMDEAGVPSKFKMTCSICGELGRNSRTCKPTKIDGSYHWLEASV